MCLSRGSMYYWEVILSSESRMAVESCEVVKSSGNSWASASFLKPSIMMCKMFINNRKS